VTDAPQVPAPLRALADDAGILLEYLDSTGSHRSARPEALLAVLNGLGIPIAQVGSAAGVLKDRRATRHERIVEPVTVLNDESAGEVLVVLREADRDLECAIETEDGERVEWRTTREELASSSRARIDGRYVYKASVALPSVLQSGYHTFTVSVRNRRGKALLIVAPRAGARGRFAEGWRAYGLFAPLFSLHSARSWGSGDLSDLDELSRFAAREQASVIATLPLLAGFGPDSFEESPYRPVSRRFWHERWIDVERVPEFAWSAAARRLASGPQAAQLRASWVHGSNVDGAAVTASKRAVLSAMAEAVGSSPMRREAALNNFMFERPELVDYARFRAAVDRFGVDWRAWPGPLRGGLLRWSDVDPVNFRYHIYAQWVAREQVVQLSERLSQRGQVLSLDLPVGIHPNGYDVWRRREQYATDVSVGAPPDSFFAQGQSWGFPPSRPEALRESGYAEFRAALAHHLRVAGMLRIDHVMGLQRLFWIPGGSEPRDGVYVKMPFEELLAVVGIEAQRNRADVIGEDLGTVADEVRAGMARAGMRRSYVAQFSIRGEGEPVLEPPPSGSVASFATHDLPTFTGWWTGRDIDERLDCGQLDPSSAEEVRSERTRLRDRLSSLLGGTGDGGAGASEAGTRDGGADGLEKPGAVLAAVNDALARSDAGLVLVQLDDVLGQEDSVNLPGTSTERPNWKRLTSATLEEIIEDPAVHDSLAPLREHRGRASSDSVGRLPRATETVLGVSRLDDTDVYLFNEGRHFRLYDKLGAHPMTVGGVPGVLFAVWAPNAERVAVVGDFNNWDGTRHPLWPHGDSGIWEGFAPGVTAETRYKYRLLSRLGGAEFDKADPFAFADEIPPNTASIVWEPGHVWLDSDWMQGRSGIQRLDEPMSIYEVHLGSWRRVPEENDRFLTYAELAPRLIGHVRHHGFTHVEILPVMEHPFYGSWGYQITGYFAPTARYGSPDEFAAFVDALHQAGIGVILDWVPSHFPSDAFALGSFDGTHLYEHSDFRQRVQPDWQSWIFNYGRDEVRSFLISSACFWLDRFHADGLRMDGVASMLYLDYSRRPGEWVPNRFGGNENLEAVEVLQACNTEVYRSFPDVVSIAEESTAWPGVSKPVDAGGLGFGYKWDMGWMHDTLDYLSHDPVHRPWHHDELTFRSIYATSEHFVLPLSHDEVVHGKGSLLGRMAGDEWQQFANLRLLFGYQFTQPGKKLLFMGGEFAQRSEWDHDASLDWHLLDAPSHQGVSAWVRKLNSLYRSEPALHRDDLPDSGFAWIDCEDRAQSVLCYERRDGSGGVLVAVANFTPVPRDGYRVGMPHAGRWEVLANSDAAEYGGSAYRVPESFEATPTPWHGRDHSASLVLPPLAIVVLGPLA
jgi:alpha-1,4-glucan:alpha-1,4-glucan 6-glycosyltransferase/4-alpha-glucanotransferase